MSKMDRIVGEVPAVPPEINRIITRVYGIGDGLKSILGSVENTESRIFGVAVADDEAQGKEPPTAPGSIGELDRSLNRLDYLTKRISQSTDHLSSL